MFLTKPILLVLTLTALVSAERFFGGFGPFGSNGAKEQNNGGKSGEKSTPTTVPVGGSTVSVPTSTVGPKCPEAKYCICVRKCGGMGGSAEKNTTATSAISSTPTTASNSNAPISPSTVSETSSTISEASSTISSIEASSTVSSTGESSTVSSVPSSSTHKNKKSGESGDENHDEEEWHGLPPQVRKRWLALHGRKHLEQQPAAAGLPSAGERNCKMECKCISVPKFSAESEEKSGEHIKGSGEKKAGAGNTGCDYKNKGVQRADCKNARVQKQKGIVSPINNNPHEQERGVKMGNNGNMFPQLQDNRGCDYLNEGAQRENCKNARVQQQKQMQIWNKFNRAN